MKKLKITTLLLFGIGCYGIGFAQVDAPNTPPEVSPMPMKPEMTEIWEPQVSKIAPGEKPGDAPSDAIILFDGENLDQWVSQADTEKAAPWAIKDGYFEVVPGSGGIQTKMKFGDAQIHIEWSAPDKVENSGQGRGNSGLFLQNRYELQSYLYQSKHAGCDPRLKPNENTNACFAKIREMWKHL